MTTAKLLQCPAETEHYAGGPRGDYAPNSYYVIQNGTAPFLGKPWSSVKQQSSTFLMVDARCVGKGHWNVHMDHMRQLGVLGMFPNDGKPWPPRHGTGMNWLFFDLHIEHITTAEMRAMTSADWVTMTGYPAP